MVAMVGVARDIGDRKRAEQRAERFLQQQMAINRLALALGEADELASIFHVIYEHIRALMDAEMFVVSFFDPSTELIRADYAADLIITADKQN